MRTTKTSTSDSLVLGSTNLGKAPLVTLQKPDFFLSVIALVAAGLCK